MQRLRSDSANRTREIADNYDRIAPWYDWLEGVVEVLFVGRMRRSLVRQARGEVLEVAVGTGRNLVYYPPDCRITAVDLSANMLHQAERRAARLGRAVTFGLMDAGQLEFPDARFDTVVSTLSTCTFPDPVGALREMARVVRPSGRLLLLEHGRSDRSWLSRWQDRRAARHFSALGCTLNREPRRLVAQAGLHIDEAQQRVLGVFHALSLRPAPAAWPTA